MRLFTGSACALITPFTREGTLDTVALDALVRWQIARGTDALVVCGTTGEASTMTEAGAGGGPSAPGGGSGGWRVPVIAGRRRERHGQGTGSVPSAWQGLGADGALAVTPYYNKTTQQGLIAHYKALRMHRQCP